jgi:hypothetical protein
VLIVCPIQFKVLGSKQNKKYLFVTQSIQLVTLAQVPSWLYFVAHDVPKSHGERNVAN